MRYINVESDFKLLESFDCNCEVNLRDSEFEFEYYTKKHSDNRITVSYKDGKCSSNCKFTKDNRLIVLFENHNLEPGTLKVKRYFNLNDADFSDKTCDFVIEEELPISLTKGIQPCTEECCYIDVKLPPYYQKGDIGPVGPKGDKGDQGDKGDKGDLTVTGATPHNNLLDNTAFNQFDYEDNLSYWNIRGSAEIEIHGGENGIGNNALLIKSYEDLADNTVNPSTLCIKGIGYVLSLYTKAYNNEKRTLLINIPNLHRGLFYVDGQQGKLNNLGYISLEQSTNWEKHYITFTVSGESPIFFAAPSTANDGVLIAQVKLESNPINGLPDLANLMPTPWTLSANDLKGKDIYELLVESNKFEGTREEFEDDYINSIKAVKNATKHAIDEANNAQMISQHVQQVERDIIQRDSERSEAFDNRQQTYEDAENIRNTNETTRQNNEIIRQSLFNTNEVERQSTFDTNEANREAEFDKAIQAAKDNLVIVNDLTTGGADKALSAEMGKKLEEKVTPCVEALDIQPATIDVTNCEIYKDGHYIGNGVGVPLGGEAASSQRAIARSLGWRKGQQIIINRIQSAGSSSCAVATYKNGTFIANLISGNGGGGYLPNVPYTFTPSYDFDEIRFSLYSANSLATLVVSKSVPASSNLKNIEEHVDNIEGQVDDIEKKLNQLSHVEFNTHTIPCITKGYLNQDGTVHENTSPYNRGITDYIKVNRTIHIVKAFSPFTPKTYICFYDKDKNFLSNEDNVTEGKDVNDVTLNVPENAVYARIVQSDFANSTTYSTYEETFAIERLQKEIDELQKKAKRFKFLLIGSSFGVNTVIQFPFISAAGGIEIICGNLYEGGGTLQDIVDIINGTNTFDAGKVFNSKESNLWQTTSADLDAMLEYTDWDVISIQRAASERGIWDNTKAANLQIIIEYLQNKTKNYNPKIIFNSLFAYPSFSTDKTDQLQDTESIITTCQQIQEQFGLEIIPTAVAVQNARMTKMIAHGSVSQIIPDLAEDDMHLDTGVGSYVCGALLYEYLIGSKYSKSILTNSYIPSLSDVSSMGIFQQSAYTQPTPEDIIISKYAAMMACRNQKEVNAQIGIRFPYQGN